VESFSDTKGPVLPPDDIQWLGTGVGILINAARDNQIENYVVAAPLLGMGGTMTALKAYPKTRHDSNKRLISNGLVGGIVGLTLGGGIDYLT